MKKNTTITEDIAAIRAMQYPATMYYYRDMFTRILDRLEELEVREEKRSEETVSLNDLGENLHIQISTLQSQNAELRGEVAIHRSEGAKIVAENAELREALEKIAGYGLEGNWAMGVARAALAKIGEGENG